MARRQNLRQLMSAVLAVLFLACFAFAGNSPKPAQTLKDELSDLFSGRTARMVWQKDTEGGWPGFSAGNPNKLLKMNSGQGVVSEFISGYGYMARPTFTWDGERVVFTDLLSKTIYVADWDNGSCEVVASGFELGACYFRDGKHWAVATNNGGAIYLINIDNGSEREQIDCNKDCLWPSLSPDGEYLAGLFPTWGHAGVMKVSTGQAVEFSNPSGCWPTMFRDDSHNILYTIEPHRNIRVVDPNENEVFNQSVGEELLPGENEYNILRGTMDPDIFTFMICLPGNNPYIERISDGQYVCINTGDQNPDEGNMDIFFEGDVSIGGRIPSHGVNYSAIAPHNARAYDLRGRAVPAAKNPGPGAYVRSLVQGNGAHRTAIMLVHP